MKIKRLIMLVVFVIIGSIGSALTLKAAIGVGAWDALAQTGNEITGIQVGTIGMFFNFSCIIVQILVLKKDFKKIQLLQIIVCLILGNIVNVVLYDLLGSIHIYEYWMNVAILISGYIICAFGVGAVMVLDIVTFALEGACMAVSKKTNKPFHVLRQSVDIVSIMIALVVGLLCNVPLAIREGTIIGMFLFGPLMGIFMKWQKPLFKKFDLIDYD